MFLLQCCGIGRRNGTRAGQFSGRPDKLPDERTPLLIDTTDELPFVPAPAAEPIDDEALLEYQRRVERIIDEVAEKLVSVSSGRVPPATARSDASRSSSSTSHSDLNFQHGRLRGESSSSHSSTQRSGHSPRETSASGSSKASPSQWRPPSSRLSDPGNGMARPRRRSSDHNAHFSGSDVDEQDPHIEVNGFERADNVGAGQSDIESSDDEHGGKTPKAGYADHKVSSADLVPVKRKAYTERKPSNAVDRLDDLLSLPHDEFAKLIAPS